MNRREFVGTALAGAGSFALPCKAVEESRPTLVGLTDEQMAAMIGRFPQSPDSAIHVYNRHMIQGESVPWRITVNERSGCSSIHSSWEVESTTIVVTTYPTSILDPVQVFDIRSLETIQFNVSELREYKRLETNGQFGWFCVYHRDNSSDTARRAILNTLGY